MYTDLGAVGFFKSHSHFNTDWIIVVHVCIIKKYYVHSRYGKSWCIDPVDSGYFWHLGLNGWVCNLRESDVQCTCIFVSLQKMDALNSKSMLPCMSKYLFRKLTNALPDKIWYISIGPFTYVCQSTCSNFACGLFAARHLIPNLMNRPIWWRIFYIDKWLKGYNDLITCKKTFERMKN